MKFEYCQKCDRPIRPEEKAHTKDGQILCEECYLRATKQEVKKAGPELTDGKYRDSLKLKAAAEIDEFVQKQINGEESPELSDIDLLKKIANNLDKQEKKDKDKKDKKRDEAIAGVVAVLTIIVFVWAYYWFDKPAETGIEKPQKVVTNRRTDGKRRAKQELRRAKAQYAGAKADLEAVRAWAEVELTKSNAILQDIINSVVSPTGELMMPEKQVQVCIDKAMKDCEIRGRMINAMVEAAEQEVREAADKLAVAKRRLVTQELN
jgi:hypothetical protein